jgi:hypothetical protein
LADEPEPPGRKLADLAHELETPLQATARHSTALERSTVLEVIDAHIASSSPRDTYLWIQARAEILRQYEFVSDRAHLRTIEQLALVSKVGLSAVAICGGIGLAFAGFGLPAFVCLGVGLYALAPNFINAIARRVLGQIPRKHG